ncbi:hypothetical protein HMPREF1214_02732 [Bacteroides sp. HPS0048]|uniref:hypothetical protein n=1 Tax=Bacteroides sp. HPS0048 TaxID=1078089 RepID=UPI00038291BA|nr:hypothetical protein [Bacteroides sp. HPS0048]EOA57220.1 hypothetical protein HMPREF1214_02732 [Bacteroides sp. HPS0048]
MREKILLIGKRPLPIGGVTIHVDRLVTILEKLEMPFSFYNLKFFSVISLTNAILKHKYAHLHSSSSIFRLFFSLMCICTHTKSIITIHGNLGRFSFVYNLMDYMAVWLSDYPIVINQNSYLKAFKINKKTLLMSAYIPSMSNEKLSNNIVGMIEKMKSRYEFICISNAYNFSLGKDGEEIYGITELVTFFREENEYGFVLSDPSGEYSKRFIDVPDNVFIINKPHPFVEVLKYVDCYIRYTSTDGDSLSIHEAIDSGSFVIATDVVDRPTEVILVHRGDFIELKKKLHFLSTAVQKDKTDISRDLNTVDIVKFYNKCVFK